jgi:hypothetical protein
VTTWGVVLMDMSIEKLEFHDSALRDLLTQRASNKLQTASNRANIAAQAQTGIQKAQGTLITIVIAITAVIIFYIVVFFLIVTPTR